MEPVKRRGQRFLAWKAAHDAREGIRELDILDFMQANELEWDEGRGILEDDEDIDG